MNNKVSKQDVIEQPVLFKKIVCSADKRIGIATLNAPATLNSVSLQMVDLLHEQLQAWAKDTDIALVVLHTENEKAFCAGGDLQALYKSMLAHKQSGSTNPLDNSYARNFFLRQYFLHYQMHSYPKPILCWANGIVMGGGMGLMAGASHRVVTEKSRLAMPEITVGLFPDVGGSWFLGHTPGRVGQFLALTGANMSAADALYAGLAEVMIEHQHFKAVLAAIMQQHWQGDYRQDAACLSAVLNTYSFTPAEGAIQYWRHAIDCSCAKGTPEQAVAAISALADEGDAWLQNAKAAMAKGCPGSIRLAWELLERSSRLSLAEVFKLEYMVIMHCTTHQDFAEGIRALLIDKDKNPQWQPALLSQANEDWAAPFFIPPWGEGEHPLAALGVNDLQRKNL